MKQRLHLATRGVPGGGRAIGHYAICHAGIIGFVRRTLSLRRFLAAADRCGNCHRMWKAGLDS